MAIIRDLPEELLADVLRRLPPRSLATARCVCRAWREAVDASRLLRADLLPLSVRGIFMNYTCLHSPEFFSRPSTGPAIWGNLDFVPRFWEVEDHCNGLLLSNVYDGRYSVANPATRRWAHLPCRPPLPMGKSFDRSAARLAFDPMVSPHYEVFLIPNDYEIENKLDTEMRQSYPLQVFSSLTGRWEERLFTREGGAAGVIADMNRSSSGGLEAVYWRGALYVYRNTDSFMSVFMANAKYKLVPMPTGVEFEHNGSFDLGRSKKGVYCAFSHDWHGLWIFSLNESCGQSEWVLEHRVNFKALASKLLEHVDDEQESPQGPFILQNINDYKYPCGNDKKPIVEEKYEWNSDDDNVIDIEDRVEERAIGYVFLMGFHPFKEVVFLDVMLRRGVAYHWNTSKFQDLGDIYPKDYAETAVNAAGIERCFPYTPCWIEDFPGTNSWDTDNED